jgi:hypothetical protein
MEIVPLPGLLDHSWRRFTAQAVVRIGVVADENIIQGQLRTQLCMDRFYFFSRLFPGPDIGLICRDQ